MTKLTIGDGPRARTRLARALMIGTMLAGVPALAQSPVPASPTPAAQPSSPVAQPGSGIIKSIEVSGNQRLEPDTVRSYIKLKAGDAYTRESLDQALKDLYASELFATSPSPAPIQASSSCRCAKIR